MLCMCLVSSWVSANDVASTPPKDLVGAVCIIRHNDSLVMISEVITQKLALPGGYIDETDTPESAAAREALEEAGISVRVVDLIQYRGRAAIYACQAVSPIFVSSFRDQRGFPIVASWYSKHFATEVDRVYLADTDKVPLSDHRYPDDVPLMEEWLAKTPNSEVLVYDRLDDTVNLLHKYELTLIQSLQQTVAQWPQTLQTLFEGAMAIMNLPGEIVFMLLVVVLTGAFTGPQRLLELLFVMLVGLFTTSLLKHGIASPRPFFALPELQKVDAHAFGFPSMHTLMATLLWGWLWDVITHSRSRSWKIGLGILFTVLILGQGVARVWYGVQFISDVVISMMVGTMIVSSFIVWRNHEPPLTTYLLNRWFWLVLTMVVGTAASYTLVPAQAYIFTVLLGIFLSVELVAKLLKVTPVVTSRQAAWVCVAVLTVTAILYGAFWFFAAQQTLSMVVLGIKASGCLLITLWLIVSITTLRHKLGVVK
ncbi:hypothetical protein ABT58_00800 [Photobacterium aphoticum]|uniref:undecaprenyl-diphosphate phosphatase n=3 Tax=Photobacterium aphoticum TaxID=754436 RepID=A0A0J1GTV2_9GAMM|nr:hypothetical protein ABT58_00800 [Photobacterium aphoticum]